MILFSLNASIEPIFKGNEFCQWLVTKNFVENSIQAENYFQELLDNKEIICLTKTNDLSSSRYAFSK